MLMSLFLTTTLLLLEPPADAYQQTQAELERATAELGELPPQEVIARLGDLIAQAQQYPHELLADSNSAARLARARLALAWAQLAVGDTAAAAATMDSAIFGAGTMDLPLAGMGPDVRKLHDERRAMLEAAGHATISVDCDGCEVVIDELGSNNPTAPLLLGTHRVWLFDPSGKLEPRFVEVELGTSGEVVPIEYRPAPLEPPVVEPEPTVQPKPRWPKFVGMSVGAGLFVAGVVLLALDGKCRGGGAPTTQNVDTCRDVLQSTVPANVLIGVGGGVLLGASVWLVVDDERNTGQRQVTAGVGWSMRF